MSKNYAYSHNYERNIINRSTDRVFKLQVKDKTKPKNSIGMVDNRLFTGENKLRAIQDVGLWYLKYDTGKIPQALDQRFTTLAALLKVIKVYFDNRNIEIIELVDEPTGSTLTPK